MAEQSFYMVEAMKQEARAADITGMEMKKNKSSYS